MNANEILKAHGFKFERANEWRRFGYAINLSLSGGVHLTHYTPKYKRFLWSAYYETMEEFLEKNKQFED